MRILFNTYNNTSFRAHSYKIEPKSSRLFIQTDNKPYLGEKPVLVYKIEDSEVEETRMDKEEKGVYETFHGKTLRVIVRTMLVANKRPPSKGYNQTYKKV